ncbi:MAG: cobalt ECF transporter T component CbiQ [Accumulibacter sp.]|uniref:cobalt ECF transporter T component CbiQ n=1 Tax=Accumulibacter sp. TaxID=2053492 RepID=UPI002FC2F07B
MLIERSAYANRWRQVSPAAKGSFALAGLIAAFAAGTPMVAAGVAAILVAVTLLGAGIALVSYLRVASPALAFLLLGSLSLAFSLGIDEHGLTLQWLPNGLNPLANVLSRSLAALAALLFLALTTPLPDLINLLRRLRTPEILLEIMVLCYRMLFVFSAAVQDTWIAQTARLGYATPRLALRSLAGLTANLTLQVWQRANDLHVAAQARNNEGPLRFLAPVFAHTGRDLAIAMVAGSSLLALAVAMS